MKLKVDLALCIKAGECYYNHPDLFQAGDDGYPVVRVEELATDAQRAEAEQAAEVCPTQAIVVEPDEG